MRVPKAVVNLLLLANMRAGFPIVPHTIALTSGWDFDNCCPPNLVPAGTVQDEE